MRSWMLGMCVLLASTPSLADDQAKAKQLYDEGLRHYQVAEYTQAIDSWKQAYLISKKPLLLFNIGQAYRLSGDCAHAMTFYDNYTDAEPNPSNQDELDQAIAACKNAKPAATTTNPALTTTTTTTPTTDTKPVETKPVETKPVETPVKVEPPPPPAPAPSGGHRGVAMIVGIGGVVLEGGAVFFALQGKSKADDVQKYVMQANVFDAKAKALQADGERANKLAWGLGIAGGAAIIAGAVLYLTGGSGDEHGVAIVPTPEGAQVGWSTTF
jgi:tetratricopeptide (TPR) repeat protein